jgi:hypothetical protein
MTHKLTGREVYDAVREQRQGHPGEFIAGVSTWIDGKVYFDALALRLNEIIVDGMTEQGKLSLSMQEPVRSLIHETAMRYRLRAYRAKDPAALRDEDSRRRWIERRTQRGSHLR